MAFHMLSFSEKERCSITMSRLIVAQKLIKDDIGAILDSNKNVVVSYVYDAWGRPINCSGTMASTLGKINPFRYRGYVYDEETGMYYLVSRYYKPEWIRFISSDVIFDTGANLLKLNTYLYVANNPISSSDINGNWIIKDAIKWLAKNVAEPIVDACESLLDNVDYTFSFGFTGSISLGFWSFSGSIGWSCDSNGNYGWQITEGAALTTGDAGVSGGIFFSATNAPDISNLEGEALAIGGSFGTGLEVSAELNIIPDYVNDKTYYGTTYVFGLSAEASAAEFHIAGSTTQTIPGTQRNAFDDCRTILGWIEDW